jgi:lipoprotein-anchoring transpeptidase ErfK/SrfK
MADYSNLFRGGGVSTFNKGRRNNKRKLFPVFIVVVIICVLIWFFYDSPSGEDAKNKNLQVSNRIVKNPDDQTEVIVSSKSIAKPTLNPEQTLSNSDLQIKKNTTPNISQKKYASAKSNLDKAIELYKQEEYVDAKVLVLKVVESGLQEGNDLWEKAAELLSKINIEIYMSDMPSPQKKLYTIQEGDSLIRIAKKFHTTVEAVQKSNGLNPANPIIFPGKTLYIYQGDWSIKVSKSKFRLYLYNGKKLFKIYNIGVGRQGRTPEGEFVITNKQKHPIWYNEGRAIAYGTKENVLGTRWMAIKPTGKTNQHLRGYGIHGTWKPETIGTKSSNGCIRMKNDEVDELFTIVPYKTFVTITK